MCWAVETCGTDTHCIRVGGEREAKFDVSSSWGCVRETCYYSKREWYLILVPQSVFQDSKNLLHLEVIRDSVFNCCSLDLACTCSRIKCVAKAEADCRRGLHLHCCSSRHCEAWCSKMQGISSDYKIIEDNVSHCVSGEASSLLVHLCFLSSAFNKANILIN